MGTAMASVARADSVKFVANDHGDPFDAVAAASPRPANPTIVKKFVQIAGLVPDDDSAVFLAPMASDHPSSTAAFLDFSNSANSSDVGRATNSSIAFDMISNQDAASNSTAASESPSNCFGIGGFFCYGDAPTSAGSTGQGQSFAGAGSKPIDLGIGHSGASDSNSSDDVGARHKGVMPRIKRPLRVLTGDPVSVPEPSSLLMLGCGVFSLALKRRNCSAD
jgi:PEP-CTERM motif